MDEEERLEIKKDIKRGIRNKLIFLFVFLTCISLVFLIFFNFDLLKSSDNFQDCLSAKNITLYVKTGCPTCANQKEQLGDLVDYLNVIDCADDMGACVNNNVSQVPTWEFDDGRVVGVYTKLDFLKKSGCLE